MLAEPNRGRARAATVAALALALIASCREDEGQHTSVKLAIDFPDETPVYLSISGRTEDGRFYGPTLLPDPLRPLAHDRETVLLRLPDAMDGELLVLNVAGLDEQSAVRMRGNVRTEVVMHTMQSAFVSLRIGAGCTSDASSSVYCTTDAGEDDVDPVASLDASTCRDALCTDGGPIAIDASNELDASAPEPMPEPMPEPEPEPEPEPMPEEPVVTELRCENMETCDLKCPAGAHCAIDCGGARDCKPVCKNAVCEIDCGDAERCHPSCEGKAVCEITCRGESCEESRCRDDAQCLLHCAGDDCDLQCEHEEDRTECAGDAVACNHACPEAEDS
jgi:hypothetical protein